MRKSCDSRVKGWKETMTFMRIMTIQCFTLTERLRTQFGMVAVVHGAWRCGNPIYTLHDRRRPDIKSVNTAKSPGSAPTTDSLRNFLWELLCLRFPKLYNTTANPPKNVSVGRYTLRRSSRERLQASVYRCHLRRQTCPSTLQKRRPRRHVHK